MLTDAKIPGSSDLRKCRLCFEAEITLIYIYKFGGSLKKIARTILDVLNHEVSKDDHFPPYVCICCCGKLLEFRAFKTKCDSLRKAYQFYLTSRQDWTKSIEEKVEIEEGNAEKEKLLDSHVMEGNSASFDKSQVEIEEINDEKEQLSNTHVLEEDPASENSKVEIEEGNAEKEQLSDTHVLEEDSASEKSQVEIEEINDEKELRLDSHVMEEDPASEKSQGQDRSLRCRKVVNYNVDQSGSEVSDPESSDWFSSQGEEVSSDDSFTSDKNRGKRKRSQVSRKQVDTAASGNSPLSGAAGLEEVTDERTEQTVCDLTAGFTVGSNAISTISSGSDGYSKSVVSGSLESSTAWVGLANSHEQQGSLRAEPFITTSDIIHNAVSTVFKPNSSQIVSKFSCAKDPVQLTNDSNGSETHSVSNLVLQYPGGSATLGKEISANYPSQSIVLKDLLEGQSFAPKVCNGSLLKNDSSCLNNSSLSVKDFFKIEVMPSSSRASGSQSRSYNSSLLNASDKEVMHIFNDDGSIPSRVESTCILEGKYSQDSAVILQSLKVTRNGQSTEMAERTTWGSRLYPVNSTIDLKSLGISLGTDADDQVPDDDKGSASQVGLQSVGLIAKEGGSQSSERVILGFSRTQLTEESSSTPVQQKKREEETVMMHEDQRSDTNRSNVLEKERREILSTQQQEDRGKVVRNSISNSLKSTACAETPSVSNIVNISCNARPSCGVPEAYTNYHVSNQSNNVIGPSQSTHAIPFPSSNTGDSSLRLKYIQNIENTPMPSAFSSQISSHRMIGPTPPANLNSSNAVSQFSVHEVPKGIGNPEAVTANATGYIPSSPFCGVSNPTFASILGYRNDKGSFGNNKCNSSSTYGRPALHTSLHSLPASQHDLFLSTSRNTTACTNLSSQPEGRGNNLTTQRLPEYLLGLTLPGTPLEISSSAALLQPESKLKSSSASKVNPLPSTSRYVAASSNLASQAEIRGNSLEVNAEDESLDSVSSTAEGEVGFEDDFDGETPVKKKTKERLCDVCGGMFYGALALNAHRKAVHGEKRFKCEKCPKAFILKHHLAQHMSMHDDSRPFVCKECGSRFKLKTHLRQHVLVHSKKAMFQCSHCEKGFHTKWQHDNHQPSHEGKVVWSCDGCTEKMTTWVAYVDHLLEHKKNRTFKCDTCSNVYDTKKSLRRHVMSHIKPLECSVCGKHFGLNELLKFHMRVHTGERPYVCKVCGKRFKKNYALKVHMKMHSDARPFKCRFCGQRTKHKIDLRRHERNVHLRKQSLNLLPSNSR